MIYLFLIGTAAILPIGAQAGSSAWLAILSGGALGFLFLHLYILTGSMCGGQSLIAYTQTLLGQWLGRLVGLLYLWYALHLGALVIRNYVDFLILAMLPQTPSWAVSLALVSVGAYAVRLGLEPLARASQIMAVFLTLEALAVTILVAPHIRTEHLLPLFDQGMGTTLREAFSVFTFPFGEVILFALFLHQVDRSEPIWKSARLGLLMAVAILVLGAARNVAVLGSHGASVAQYPNLWVIQAIDIAEFLTRIDAFVAGSWIMLCVAKVSVCIFATASGLAEWTGLKSYRTLVWPIATWMAALSLLVYRNVAEQARFATEIWPVYSLPFQVMIPLILLGLAGWRRLSRQGGS